MKRSSIVLCVGLLSMSACTKKNSQKPLHQKSPGQLEKHIGSDDKALIYDDQEHAFILDDTGSPFGNTVSQQGEGQSLWLEDEDSLDIETIYFAFNQYKIAPEQMKTVKRVADQVKKELRNSSQGVIVIHGHACSSAGAWKYNMVLSEQRALEVKKALVKLGVPENRLKVVGHGFEEPKVASGTREQQAPNRRVEFSLVVPK